MGIAEFLKEHWQVIQSSPLTFILLSVILVGLTASVTRALMGDALEATRERLQGARDEIDRLKTETNGLKGEKDVLLGKLSEHGEDIATLKSELAKLPRIHVSTNPPQPGEGKDGDIFVVVDK